MSNVKIILNKCMANLYNMPYNRLFLVNGITKKILRLIIQKTKLTWSDFNRMEIYYDYD